MNSPEVIQRLERILVDSLAMLAAATEGRWDDLIALGGRRADLIHTAAQIAPIVFNSRLEQHKARLIQEILDADEQVKTRTRAWMNELDGVLTSVHVERKLANAYARL